MPLYYAQVVDGHGRSKGTERLVDYIIMRGLPGEVTGSAFS